MPQLPPVLVLLTAAGALASLASGAECASPALMQEGPLEDIFVGEADAPNTIVEYASTTCSHCARFHNEVYPKVKEKYIDTGEARYVMREFPLDGLAVAAFMLARCAGEDRYYPMIGDLFETQDTWVLPGEEGQQKLLLIAKQAGFSQERFDQCLADKELFDKIVETRQKAHEEFGVDSTPTFFVNGRRLEGGYQLENFEASIDGGNTGQRDAGPASTSTGEDDLGLDDLGDLRSLE